MWLSQFLGSLVLQLYPFHACNSHTAMATPSNTLQTYAKMLRSLPNSSLSINPCRRGNSAINDSYKLRVSSFFFVPLLAGLDKVHHTWAGTCVPAAMVFLLPGNHFILLQERDCLPVALWRPLAKARGQSVGPSKQSNGHGRGALPAPLGTQCGLHCHLHHNTHLSLIMSGKQS